MPTPLELAGKGAMGNVNYWVIPAVAGSIPTVAEINASGAVDITGFLYADGIAPTHSANKVTAPRRMADKRVYMRFGLTNDDIGDLKFMIDPTVATSADGKKAATACAEFSSKFLVRRTGYDLATDPAVAQWIRWTPVTFGPQFEVADTSAEENEIYVAQAVVITVPGWSNLVQIAA